jgi:hypothetical protein
MDQTIIMEAIIRQNIKMETVAVPKTQTEVAPIQWKQLWSLASLYASIIIGWIAYENYQPKLLVQFSFTNFTFALVLAQR